MTTTKKTTPTLPEKVKVQGVEFQFITGEEALRKFMDWEDTDSLGFFAAKEHIMVIHPDQPELSQGDTSFHEVLHSIWWQTGARQLIDPELEEKIVSLLSGPLFDFVRRNPEYIAYLQSLGE